MEHQPVFHPPDGSLIADVSIPDASHLEAAIQAAVDAQHRFEDLSASSRANALDQISAQLARRRQEAAEIITSETGKPIKWSLVEVQRVIRPSVSPPRRRAASVVS